MGRHARTRNGGATLGYPLGDPRLLQRRGELLVGLVTARAAARARDRASPRAEAKPLSDAEVDTRLFSYVGRRVRQREP